MVLSFLPASAGTVRVMRIAFRSGLPLVTADYEVRTECMLKSHAVDYYLILESSIIPPHEGKEGSYDSKLQQSPTHKSSFWK